MTTARTKRAGRAACPAAVAALLMMQAAALCQTPAPVPQPVAPAAREVQAQVRPVPPPTAAPRRDVIVELDSELTGIVDYARGSVVSIRGFIQLTAPQRMLVAQVRPGAPAPIQAFPPTRLRVPVYGSGFFISRDVVVTAAEVVSGIDNPTVVFPDGTEVAPVTLSTDERADVAVLRVEAPRSEDGLTFADSFQCRPGNLAVLIGNQFGFADSASLGLISSVDRRAWCPAEHRHFGHLIQFQGEVTPGASGSPLLDARGQVVGMVIGAVTEPPGAGPLEEPRNLLGGTKSLYFVAPPGPPGFMLGGGNMGFALPAFFVKRVAEALASGHKYAYNQAWMGIVPAESSRNGLLPILRVVQGGPADQAGLQPGDLLQSIDNATIQSRHDLWRALGPLKPGQQITAHILRGSKPMALVVRLIAMPEAQRQQLRKARQLRRAQRQAPDTARQP